MSYQELQSDAEWFCNQAEAASNGSPPETRFSSASILFSFMAIESFINNMMSDFTALPSGMFTSHERGFLAERAVELAESGANAGSFVVTDRQRYWSLESKIMFLVARFSGDTVDKGSSLWQRFEQAKDVRDLLTHPKKDGISVLSPKDARLHLDVAKEIIQLVSQKVWGKKMKL